MIKGSIILVFVGLLVAFAYQNAALVEVNILVWTFEIRRIVIISASFFIGVAVGWLFAD